jgi:hypothetical protein
MTTEAVQDILSFNLRTDTVVSSETVKLIVQIATQSSSGTSEEELRAEIGSVLTKFVPTAKWEFSNLTRNKDVTGYERISLVASTRVPETENHKLDERAEEASRQGLRIVSVQVDSTIPGPILRAADRKLRSTLLKEAMEELDEINKLTKLTYRLGTIEFGDTNDPVFRKDASIMAYASTANAAPMGAAGGGAPSLGNTQKVSMTAAIQLSRLIN